MTPPPSTSAPRPATVLVVEDDPKTAASLRLYLEHAGYRVLTAPSGTEGLESARRNAPDLLVLDLLLPGLDGLSVCRALREESSVPILMLTARTTEEDRLKGLNLGADDYVSKPFSPREVVARVRAVLRRTARAEEPGPRVLRCGEIELDRARHAVTVSGRPVSLTPAEFRLLDVLARAPGRVFTREELLERVFGGESESLDRTVDAHVKNLRSKIKRGRADPSFLRTVHGIGYMLSPGADDA